MNKPVRTLVGFSSRTAAIVGSVCFVHHVTTAINAVIAKSVKHAQTVPTAATAPTAMHAPIVKTAATAPMVSIWSIASPAQIARIASVAWASQEKTSAS